MSFRGDAVSFVPTIGNMNSTNRISSVPSSSYASRSAAVRDGGYRSSNSIVDNQSRLLNEITRRVQEHSYYMRKAMDVDDLSLVLEKACRMLDELGGGEFTKSNEECLTSRSYYELYMKVLDEIPNLEEYLINHRISNLLLYDIVQYSTRVIPRLYLQICVGCVRLRECPTDVAFLEEILEQVKSIQNPLRGLFLRNYFIQVIKENVPRDLLVQNFLEMNQLWIRLTLHSKSETKEIRKKKQMERTDLRTLVGTNLVRLSQLEMDIPCYKQVLQVILGEVETCNDALAQAYLLDCIVQAFPDEFHIQTLDLLTSIIPKLKEKVNLKTILERIMERIIFLKEESSFKIPTECFYLFEDCIKACKQKKMDVLKIQTCLLLFSLKCYPHKTSFIQNCFIQAHDCYSNDIPPDDLEKFIMIPLDTLSLQVLELDHFSTLVQCLPRTSQRTVSLQLVRAIAEENNTNLQSLQQVEKLYKIILPLIQSEEEEEEEDVRAEAMEQNLVARLVHLFQHDDTDELFKMFTVARKNLLLGGQHRIPFTIPPLIFAVLPLLFRIHSLEFANKMSEEVINDNIIGEVVDKTKSKVIEDVVVSEEMNKDNVVSEEMNKDNVVSEAEDKTKSEVIEDVVVSEETNDNIVSDVDDKTKNEVIDEVGMSEETNENAVSEADETKGIIKKVTPSIPFDKKITTRKVFLFLQKLVSCLSPCAHQLSFQIYLQLALVADQCCLENVTQFQAIAYEFMAQAFELIEESKSNAITLLVGTLKNLRSFVREDYEALITKTTQYAAKLHQKPDQCRMILLCSHLFEHKPQRVLECLQRCLKIADACHPNQIQLFLEIFDRYVYYFDKGLQVIQVKFLSGLIVLIQEQFDTAFASEAMGSAPSSLQDAFAYFQHILNYIKKKQQENDPQFLLIQC